MQINKQSVKIREALEEDLNPLVEMAKKSFLQAFTANNKLENVESYLDEAFTIDQFKRELPVPASTFYIAEINKEIIGYTKLNLVPAQTDIHDPESLEIARLYVLQEYIGFGLGKELLDKAFAFAKQKGLKYVWLGVWEHNPRAIRFYQKNGFEKFSTHPFPFGDEIQTDWLMKKLVI
ncbi:GNAT family N-acetyltransferase [Algoriphagus sp.]|uniref:GNAT family N-acetyltransferase n=1 Tax=Algoriphagus sp. TaxID=1872435 RepID=UPI0025DC9ECE|nr:GNAT family N-acetyltransferase [Algoriphagus sp.]